MRGIEQIGYENVKQPAADGTGIPVLLSDETMKQRYEACLLYTSGRLLRGGAGGECAVHGTFQSAEYGTL